MGIEEGRRKAVVDGKIFYFTPGTDEQYVLKEVLIDRCYEMDYNKEDKVLNIGGHIGSYDIYVADKVKQVITLEPYKHNYDLLLQHLKVNGIENVMALPVAGAKEDGVTILTIGINGGHNTTMPFEGDEKVEVPAVGIKHLIETYGITKIKCDCEGGEIEMFRDMIVPDTVNEMMFETHEFMTGVGSVHNLMGGFEKQGFDVKLIDNDPLDRTHLLHCKR